jgi:hypothetical protein
VLPAAFWKRFWKPAERGVPEKIIATLRCAALCGGASASGVWRFGPLCGASAARSRPEGMRGDPIRWLPSSPSLAGSRRKNDPVDDIPLPMVAKLTCAPDERSRPGSAWA